MTNCRMCDQSGIMWLQPGNIKAPCLACSAHRKLEDLEDELSKKITAKEEFKARILIQEHNKRIVGIESSRVPA